MSDYKAKLIEAYVDRVVDNMDVKDLMNFVTEILTDTYDDYTLPDLETEIEETYPDILEALYEESED